MARLTWLTDIHFNFLTPQQVAEFCAELARDPADAFLIGGDIGEAPSFSTYLQALEVALRRPVYFVLGNHDFYRSSIAEVRAEAERLTRAHEHLFWLPAAGPVEVGPGAGLIGHDGWGDARLGDFDNSPLMLTDYALIHELRGIEPPERKRRLMRLGEEAAATLRPQLRAALERFERIFLLTHVPPFREGTWRREGPGHWNDDWLPHFTCGAVGEMLREEMSGRDGQHVTVLCGHTHRAGRIDLTPNIRVITGGAEYKAPEVQERFSI